MRSRQILKFLRSRPSVNSRQIFHLRQLTTTTSTAVKDEPFLNITTYLSISLSVLGAAGIYKTYFQTNTTELKHDVIQKLQSDLKIADVFGSNIRIENFVENTSSSKEQSVQDMLTATATLEGTGDKGTVRFTASKTTAYNDFNTSSAWTLNTLQVEREGPDGENSIINVYSNSSPLSSSAIEVDKEPSTQAPASGSSILLPMVMGAAVGIGLSILIIRLMKNRGSDVYRLALSKVETNPKAIEALGKPIKSSSADYAGIISPSVAKFQAKCTGPKGEGTLHVHAVRDTSKDPKEWKFSHLALDISGRPLKIKLN